MSRNEESCVLASLILMDDDVPITAEKISTILKAAGVSVEPYWPGLFAKAAAGLDLKHLVSNVGSGVGTGAPAGGSCSAPAVTATSAAAPAEKKEEKKEEPEEESDDDMGFGLFD